MAGRLCGDCTIRLRFYKKKYKCDFCRRDFCDRCMTKVKNNKDLLWDKLSSLQPGRQCLNCVVLKYRSIRREHLFLLANKDLAQYLSDRNVSTTNCKEKYHLVDLIMDLAEESGLKSNEDIDADMSHQQHVEQLRRAALQRQREEADRLGSSMGESNGRDRTSSSSYDSERNDFTSPDTDRSQPSSASPNSQPIVEDYDDIRVEDYSDIRDSRVSPDPMNMSQERRQSEPAGAEGGGDPLRGDSEDGRRESSFGQFNMTHTMSNPNLNHLRTNSKPPGHRWRSMDDVKSEEDISTLAVMELKQILTANFIEYKGCCEKRELIEKVKMLYQSEQKIKQESSKAKRENPAGSYEQDICKICMDRTIDCVLLDCGHLVACAKCGKRLAECPVCRTLVARVVHIFRT